MKRIFAFFGVVLILAVCLILPVSASSPAVIIQPPAFEPPFINKYPAYLNVFSVVEPDFVSNFTWSRDDLLNVQNPGESSVSLYFMFLDDDHNLLDINSFQIEVIRRGEIEDTLTSSHNYIIFDPRDYLASASFVLKFATPVSTYASFCCVIPLYSSDLDLIPSLISSYQGSFFNRLTYDQGFSAGLDAGGSASYQDGVDYGYSLGVSDGEQSGYSSGYTAGSAASYSNGYRAGFDAGAAQSQSDLSAYSNAVFDTVSAPFRAIGNFLNFEIFGINLAGLFAFLVTAVIVGFIIKKFI